MWLDKLKQMKEKSGMTTKMIAQQSGIPEPTLEKLFAGATRDPKLTTMQQLVHFLGYTLDDLDDLSDTAVAKQDILSGLEQAHIKKYRSLDPYGKEAVDGVLDVEHRRCEAERDQAHTAALHTMREREREEPEEKVIYITSWYPAPMSAGTGQIAGSDGPEELELTRRPPKGTSYVAPVCGDSMAPTYHDGDRLFIRACEGIEVGQIGVFYMDGQQYIKELGNGVLISHNSNYAPIPMREDIRCQGLVLGVCDESYFA